MVRKLRFSIAGLMGTILFAALVLTASRNPSETWDGVILLLTCAALMLAVVGAICRSGAKRIWWLGFALFGWGYLALVCALPWESLRRLPTTFVINLILPRLAEPVMRGGNLFPIVPQWYLMVQIGHSLCALVVAAIGGGVSLLLFGVPDDRPEKPVAEPAPGPAPEPGAHAAKRAVRKRWRRPVVIAVVVLGLFAVLALMGLMRISGLLVGVTCLFTWALIGLAAIGALYGRGQRRARWLGTALFGAGYMIVIFGPGFDQLYAARGLVNHVLNALRARLPDGVTELPASSKSGLAADRRIVTALEQPLSMSFANETPLEDVLRYIKEETRGSDGRTIPIYVDPVGLNEAEQTMTSPVTLDLEGVPLKTTLDLLLKQLGLVYRVQEGLLFITAASSRSRIAANRRIVTALEQPLSMNFANETPLEDILKYIQQETKGPDGRPIPIYVDPVGLNEAEKTITSPVTLDLEGVPLKTTLDLLLKQLGLIYRVQDGVLVITSEDSGDEEDLFWLLGNCVFALLAAGLGAALGPLVAGRSAE